MTKKDEIFLNKVLKGIVIANKKIRLDFWRNCFVEASISKLDHWSCLFKAFELIQSENYENIDLILNKTKRLQDYQFGYGDPVHLCRLLARAYAYRRKANFLYDKLMRIVGPHYVWEYLVYAHKIEDDESLFFRTLKESSKRYEELVSDSKFGVPSQIRIASYHSLGIIERMKIYEIMKQIRKQEKPFAWAPQIDKEEQWFNKAIIFSEKEGIIFAQSYTRKGQLLIDKHNKILEGKKEPSEIMRNLTIAKKCCECAIDKTTSIQYGPPYLALAYIEHLISKINGDNDTLKNSRKLLIKAADAMPFDETLMKNYESYFGAWYESLSNDAEYSEFLKTRLTVPSESITKQLQNNISVKIPKSVFRTTKDKLIILKKWSSYSPLIKKDKRISTFGGGYLINWENKLIAIDPGVGFIDSMQEYGVYPYDLDAIMITHDDMDHQQEMQSLLSLIGESDSRFSNKNLNKKETFFLFSQSSLERWPKSRLPKFQNIEKRYRKMASGRGKITLFDNKVSIKPVKTFGHFDIGDRDKKRDKDECGTGVGFVLELSSEKRKATIRVGITGDTAYCSKSGEIISKHYQDCDVIILHISTVDDLSDSCTKIIKHDLDRYENFGFRGYYKKHLGFWGTVSFIEDIIRNTNKVPIFLLSEFGEELQSSRKPICQEIDTIIKQRNKLKNKNICFPTDIDTRISLPTKKILCQYGKSCLNGAKNEKGLIEPYENIVGALDPNISHQQWRDRQIFYLCKSHEWITESDGYLELC